MDLVKLVPFVLFTIECYHVVGHLAVLLRLRLLPRRDLVRIRLYFLFDLMTVYIVSFFYTKQLQWLAALQIAQHMYFFATWNEAKYTRKVISWSSLDWLEDTDTKHRWEPEMALGTFFDVVVHFLNSYLLSAYIERSWVVTGLLSTVAMSLLILMNPRLAWTTPSFMKHWVKRRVEKVAIKDVDASMLNTFG